MVKSPLDAWKIAESGFPTAGQPDAKMRFLLNYAVLAPSGHNTQPWLFKVNNDRVELYADRTRALAVVDPDDRELTISCGAALLHLRIALRHFGYADETELFPDANNPDLLACVHLGSNVTATAEEDLLFQAIERRRTNRQAFEDRPVPDSLLQALQTETSSEGAWLYTIQENDKRNAVAELIAQGDRIQMEDKRFRRELAAWIHPNRSQSLDGIPGYAEGFGDLMSYAAPLVIRTFDLGGFQAAKDQQLTTGSPVLVVMGTDADTPADWLHAGQALARVLLRAKAEDVWASFLNQPIEVSELRPQLREMLGVTGFPQLLLRMGYGSEVKPTPRRPAHEVLIH